jgi:hypothetical protein
LPSAERCRRLADGTDGRLKTKVGLELREGFGDGRIVELAAQRQPHRGRVWQDAVDAAAAAASAKQPLLAEPNGAASQRSSFTFQFPQDTVAKKI